MKTKKLLSILLALCLLLTLLPAAVSAEEISAEPEVTSIQVDPISMIEGTNGNIKTDGNGNEYYEYDWRNRNVTGTVNFVDGTSIAFDNLGIFEYKGEAYSFSAYDSQKTDHWTAGNTYTVSVSLMDVSAEVSVTIEETPIARIEIDPLILVEEYESDPQLWEPTIDADGNEYFHYWWHTEGLSGLVMFKDGSSADIYGTMFEYKGELYQLRWKDNQYAEHWTVGNTYTGTVDLMGVSTEVQVTIVESPIASITVKPLSIVEESYGHMNVDSYGNEYYYYDWAYGVSYTVNFKDGTTKNLRGRDFEHNGEWYHFDYYDEQETNPWTVGNTYTATVNLLGASTEVQITIEESPVVSIEAAPISMNKGTIDDNGYGYYHYWWADHLAWTVNLADGTSVDVNGPYFEYHGVNYYPNCIDSQDTDHWVAGNTYTATVELMGASAEVKVTVEESFKEDQPTEPSVPTEPSAPSEPSSPTEPSEPKLDIDVDEDGKADINIDTDNDGKADVNMDRDGDSKADLNVDTDGDGKADENVDTDGDGLPNYEVVEGNNGRHNKNEKNDLTFKINGLFSGFQGLEINGQTVAKENYEVREGSTIVTLNADYLATLEEGSYEITAVYTDGKTGYSFAVADTVDKEEQQPTDPKPTEPEATEPKPTEPEPTVPEAEGPQTGDTMDFLPWIALLLLSAAGIVLCLILLERKRRAVR